MAVAQGIAKISSIIKQSALGTPGAGAGGQVLRRVTSVFTADRDTFENNEIIAHQQSTGIAYGLKKVSGKLSGLLSPSTYKLLFASALRKDFVAGATSGALIIVTAATTTGVQGTFTRSGGSYLTDGFKVGDVVRWTGWAGGSATNNNSSNMFIIALTALIMTVTRFDAVPIVSDAAGDSVTCTVVGKKTLAPLTAHTNDYFTFEEWYADLSKSELFTDCKVNQIDIGLPATGNCTFSADIMGLARASAGAQVLTTPTAATVTPVVTSSAGIVYANGIPAGNVTGANISISDSLQQGDAIVGSNSAIDIARGRIKVSGSFTALFSDTVLSALYDAETAISLVIIMLDTKANPLSSFMGFSLGRIKLTSDAPDDGEKTIVRTYNFTAELNSAGGAALAWDQTIMTIQDSDA